MEMAVQLYVGTHLSTVIIQTGPALNVSLFETIKITKRSTTCPHLSVTRV